MTILALHLALHKIVKNRIINWCNSFVNSVMSPDVREGRYELAGGFKPFEKYDRQIGSFPQRSG